MEVSMMNWKKRKVYRRGNNSYEVIGVCESFDQLKKYIKKGAMQIFFEKILI